jgi:aspartate racemase
MKRCGIIGGMGPVATADLYRSITRHTRAGKDQNHLRIIIDSHPQIPDRTAAILSAGESPAPYLLESIEILQNAKVDFIICPCNTAHFFLRRMKTQIKVPFIDMIDETMKFLYDNNIAAAGLLSTAGTAKSGIYRESAEKFGIEIILPSEKEISAEMEAIGGKEGIKAGFQFEKSKKNKTVFLEIIENFRKKGIDAVIMGCTEIALCLEKEDTLMTLINPTDILAKTAISFALKQY